MTTSNTSKKMSKPPPLQMPDLSTARSSLVNSPHKSVMAALEYKAVSNSEDETWETIKAKGVKRLNEDLYCCLKIDRNASSSDIKKVRLKSDHLFPKAVSSLCLLSLNRHIGK
jgi:hypothetical protein